VAVSAAGCSSSDGEPAAPVVRPVSEAEAVAVIDRAVVLASAGDLEGLCAMTRARLMCESSLRSVGHGSVPDADPQVLRTTVHEPVHHRGGGVSLGGTAVEVCGTDGLGRPYRSEVMVLDQGDGPEPMDPIYWTPRSYARLKGDGTTASVDATPTPAPVDQAHPGCSPTP
jgi:hypothetical protein